MRVLIVEDDPKLGRLLQRGLSEEGHAADYVREGDRALVQAAEITYDAIIVDVGLPGIDGFETCRRLRALGVWSAVLMLTARDAVEDRVRGLDCGADDYLTKPFSFAELAARLRAVGRRGTLERPATLTVGDLHVDPATLTATRAGVEIELSPKEFALLETLMREPGRVFSRLELLERAWDYGYEWRSNVIDVYVGYLRKKLDAPDARSTIETVRGVGYRVPRPTG
ncbi:MAG TPA: response regulator transcription factor [Candidatus Limnocylindrales bacterium]|nr:response regulator transcription factor [Candidatus Limnocylindrales bacterium]